MEKRSEKPAKRELPVAWWDERSSGHMCFATRPGGSGPMMLDPEGEYEFRVDKYGAALFRSLRIEQLSEGVRINATVCATGVGAITQICEKLKCELPEATARRIAENEAVAQTGRANSAEGGGVMAKKNSTAKKDGGRPKGVKHGRTILEEWDALFQENEQRVNDGKKPLTDEQLIERMEEEFPASKGKSTLTRPRMFRMMYNTGKFLWTKKGSAADRKLPESCKYDEAGNRIEAGKRKAAAADEPNVEKSAKAALKKNTEGRKSKAGKARVVRRAKK